MPRPRTVMIAGSLGFALAYFLDPNTGTRRRRLVMDRLRSSFRGGSKSAATKTEYVTQSASGTLVGVAPHQEDNPNPDDGTIRDRVETELFRPEDFPKGQINVNVANGIVELRGELSSSDQITSVVERVRSIPHVRGVHNYLHLPNTPAPNKAEVLEISSGA